MRNVGEPPSPAQRGALETWESAVTETGYSLLSLSLSQLFTFHTNASFAPDSDIGSISPSLARDYGVSQVLRGSGCVNPRA